jgi:hypothetical protein
VSLQVTTVVAVAIDDENVHEETEEPAGQRVPAYANEPLISSNATPPVTYTRLQGVTSVPRRARIDESDFCLTEPENWSVRKTPATVVAENWFKEVSAFFQDQSPSRPKTTLPAYGPFPTIQR